MLLRRKAMKRCFSAIILSLLLLATCLPADSAEPEHSENYSAGIFCRRLQNVTMTGDYRTDIINIAMSQIGYVEGNNSSQISGIYKGSGNYTEYGRWYDKKFGPEGFQRAAWCAMFVSWCAQQAQVPEDIFYQHAYTPYGLNWYDGQDLTYTREDVENGEYVPRPGDVVYFRTPGVNRTVNHVGLVLKYESGVLYTIEGNANSGDRSNDGGQVCLKSYPITDTFIRFICTPTY